ncbi:leucine-rich repeat flightless-interacting protein 1 isoform X29 [Marmota marmota marmota]|uniref:leucine-rich repeat flightless-interacting protein 1 isoform X29 n=1 Tax=Marmota marmota marmota TaxID=9994 RepID=UPI002093CDD2|nr:leucine-rich repeat flightless-interacting protein 1 isoform X29 [Marmota marmota marmota]
MASPAGSQNKEIDCLSPEAQRLAEARLAAKRAARAEAREIRMKELERQQKEEDSERHSRRSRRSTSASDEDERMSVGSRGSLRVEERPEKDFAEKGSRNMPGLSAATLASLGGTSSRRGSGDTSVSIDTEASIREIKELNELKDQIQDVEGKYMQGLKEMKDSLAEVEEKYKKAMVSNAQLDNEKTNFMYQVDNLKDTLLELEEQLAESRRQYEEKSKEFEREKHAHSVLQFQFAEVKEALRQREEMLEKHGIILNSEIANNGETSDTLNNVGYQGSTKITKEELNALKSAGDGTLGRATEVKVKNEIVENMGKRAILQNTEQGQHKEDTVKDYVSHPGENVEEQKTSGDSAPSPGPRANANCEEQVHNQVLENTAFLESPGQVESRGVIDVPDGETGASLEQPGYWRDLDKEAPVPTSGQDSCTALDIKSQSEPSVGRQEKEKQEDWKSDLEEVSPQTCQESAPVPIPEVERMSRTDAGGPSGGPLGSIVEAGGVPAGEQVGTVPASPLKHGDDPVSQGGQCVFSTSAGQSLEKELTNQEATELREAPVHSTEARGKNSAEKGGATEVRDEEPGHAEPQPVPGAPAAKGSHQEATGSGRADAEGELLDAKEPEEEKSDQQAEASESPQKKSKNKKKKNKKKRSPAAAESLEGVKKELSYQDAEVGEIKEEEQVQFSDKKRVVESQNEVTQNPEQKIVAGSREPVDCPGNRETELNGKLQQEGGDVKTRAEGMSHGGTLSPEGGTVESSGASASDKALDEDGDDKAASSAQSSPREPEKEEGDSSSLLGNSPSVDTDDASRAESAKRQDPSQHPGQVADKAQDSLGQESSELSAAAGEAGDSSSEGGREAGEGSERGKSKEDCTMS